MKRLLVGMLVTALLLANCASALAEEGVSARTGIYGATREKMLNLELAVGNIDGTFVPSGSSFSFNGVTGPRGRNNGYRDARDGSGALVTGGGADQVATTLYLALIQLGSDIRLEEKHCYGDAFTGGYVSDGSCAIRVDSAGDDFIFTNYGGEMTIHMTLTDDALRCELSIPSGPSNNFLSWPGRPQYRTPAASASLTLSGTDALISNVSLAASSINDTVLLPGDLFSFNDIVGPRTERYGYQSAVNGRGINVVGGGVAQVASVIWLAIKNLDGIAIVEKSTYGGRYDQHYVRSSNDAILTDYNGKTDFSFRNSGSSALTIATYVDGDALRCDIYRN